MPLLYISVSRQGRVVLQEPSLVSDSSLPKTAARILQAVGDEEQRKILKHGPISFYLLVKDGTAMLGAAHTEAAPSVIFDILDHLMNVVVEAGGLELGLSSLKEYLSVMDDPTSELGQHIRAVANLTEEGALKRVQSSMRNFSVHLQDEEGQESHDDLDNSAALQGQEKEEEEEEAEEGKAPPSLGEIHVGNEDHVSSAGMDHVKESLRRPEITIPDDADSRPCPMRSLSFRLLHGSLKNFLPNQASPTTPVGQSPGSPLRVSRQGSAQELHQALLIQQSILQLNHDAEKAETAEVAKGVRQKIDSLVSQLEVSGYADRVGDLDEDELELEFELLGLENPNGFATTPTPQTQERSNLDQEEQVSDTIRRPSQSWVEVQAPAPSPVVIPRLHLGARVANSPPPSARLSHRNYSSDFDDFPLPEKYRLMTPRKAEESTLSEVEQAEQDKLVAMGELVQSEFYTPAPMTDAEVEELISQTVKYREQLEELLSQCTVHLRRREFSQILAKTIPFDREDLQRSHASFRVGDRVVVTKKHLVGTVRYFGAVEFSPDAWVGIELDKPAGRHDGTVEGVRYFSCPEKHGVFCRPGFVMPYYYQQQDGDALSSSTRRSRKSGSSHGSRNKPVPRWGSRLDEKKPQDKLTPRGRASKLRGGPTSHQSPRSARFKEEMLETF